MARSEVAAIAQNLKDLRKLRGWNQNKLAETCGGTQAQVSRWTKGLDRPGPAVLAKLAQLGGTGERTWWIEESGLADIATPGAHADDDLRTKPLVKEAAGAGTPRVVEERVIERNISFPHDWLPRGGKVYALRIKGDSMAPIIDDGAIVLADVAQRDPHKVVGRMVAAREGNGVTIKWLRKDQDVHLLVPPRCADSGMSNYSPGR